MKGSSFWAEKPKLGLDQRPTLGIETGKEEKTLNKREVSY